MHALFNQKDLDIFVVGQKLDDNPISLFCMLRWILRIKHYLIRHF